MTTIAPHRRSPRGQKDQDTRPASLVPTGLARHDWIVALVLYTAISLLLGHAVLADLNDRIIGPANGDNYFFPWSLWEFRDSILKGQDPTHTHLIFALLPPVEHFVDALFVHLLALPLQSLTSPIGAYDIGIILSFILSGLFMYLLAGEFVESRLACFTAGFLYDFSAFHLARAMGHLGLTTMQWLPFCAWRLFALYRRPTLPNAVLAGLGLALVPMSEVYYLPYFELPFVGLFVLYVLATDRGWLTHRRNIHFTAVAALVAWVVAAPYLATFLVTDPDLRANISSLAQQDLEVYSADLLAFVLPNPNNPLLGSWTTPIYLAMKVQTPVERAVFLGYPAMLLAFIGVLFRRNRNSLTLFWAIVGAVGLLLALGPELFVAGHRVLPLPTYRLAFGWSALSSFRAPDRLGVLPLMSICVLAAYGLHGLETRFGTRRNGRVFVLGGAVVLMVASLLTNAFEGVTLPSSTVPVPALDRIMAQDKSQGLVLDLPLYPLDYYAAYSHDQYLQSVHHKPLVSGVTERVTDGMILAALGQPYLALFNAIQATPQMPPRNATGSILPANLGFREQLLEEHIRYVVLHLADNPEGSPWMERYLEQRLGRPFYSKPTEGLVAWRVEGTPPSGIFQFRLGSGWLSDTGARNGSPEQAVQQDGQIIITAPDSAIQSLQFQAFPYPGPLLMEVRLNGVVIRRIPFKTEWLIQTVKLPRLALHRGRNVLEIHAVEGCKVAGEFMPGSPDPRCFSFGIQNVRLRRAAR